jgi:hypothetical protein
VDVKDQQDGGENYHVLYNNVYGINAYCADQHLRAAYVIGMRANVRGDMGCCLKVVL